MVDRPIVYAGALPQTTDLLNMGKFTLVGQAYQNRAMLGTSTVVSGLAATPSSPTADLRVTIGVGSIYQMDPTDTAAYSDLGVDNNSIMKQGILAAPAVLTITPPATAGFSQVYLVQAILSDVDAGQMVLSYYNSANPASPYSGPANAGTSNYTTRTNPCTIALKAGVAATTGTQVTPAPDPGYTGLYAVTVANGQTQITSANIVQLPSAPFFPTLPSVPGNVLNGSWVYAGQDTGTPNAYVITFAAGQPIPSAYVAGMGVKFKALNANVAVSTPVNAAFSTSTTGGTLAAGTYYYRVSATNAAGETLASAETSQTTTGTTSTVTVNWGAVTGATGYKVYGRTTGAELLIATLGNVTTYTDTGSVTPAGALPTTNTTGSASTVNVNGLGPISIRRATGTALAAYDINSGQIVELTYDGANFQMANYLGSGATSNTTTTVSVPYAVDSGTQNAVVATYSPAITAGQQVPGLVLSVKLANTITGSCSINVNGLGVKNVLTGDLANPPNGVFVANEVLLLVYDGTYYQIMNTSSLTYRKPSANTTIYVNTAIGNDANDGTANTAANALKTIQAGVTKAFSYAPSQFTITVAVQPGTYNESVTTPLYAGPNVIVDGLNAASVTVIAPSGGNCFTVQGPNTMTVRNVTVQSTAGGAGFLATAGATMTTGGPSSSTASNAIGGAVFEGYGGGTINIGSHTYQGSATVLWWGIFGGTANFGNSTSHVFSSAISVSQASAQASNGGFVTLNSSNPPTFTNPSYVSGTKYNATYNGIISASGLGVNFFPGTVAGTTSVGGQYAS